MAGEGLTYDYYYFIRHLYLPRAVAQQEITATCFSGMFPFMMPQPYICSKGNMQDQESSAARVGYDPNRLLDALIVKLELKNDAALARALEIPPPLLSKIRHRKTSVSAPVLIRMHEVSSLSIRELRDLMGDRRKKYRVSNAYTLPKAEGMLEKEDTL